MKSTTDLTRCLLGNFQVLGFLILLVLVILPGEAMGQAATTGTILGVVSDETGGVLPGVTVSLVRVETGVSRTVVSNDVGYYRSSNLALGSYTVRTELSGFQTVVRTGIVLTVGREAVVNFQLTVGEISEEVVVTGEASLVNTTRAVVSSIVGEQTITDLPLNGRSYDQLALLQPGVSAVHTSGTALEQGRGQKMSIGGARPQQNNFYLDGTSMNNHNNTTPGSASGTVYGVDTIQEFEILTTSYSAEYTSAGGGIINVVTKSGTNELHGSIFAFHRNDNLDATNFMTNRSNLPKPEFKRNQFGGTVGGPIVNDRLFFLGAYEGLRDRLGVTKSGNVMDDNARLGILPTETIIVPANVQPFIDLYPRANGENFLDGTAEHAFSASDPTDEDYFTAKIDFAATNTDSFFGRYTFIDGASEQARIMPGFSAAETSRSQYVSLNWTHQVSPSLLNEARIGFNRTRLSGEELSTLPFPVNLGFLEGNGLPMGTVDFRGDLDDIGPQGGDPDRRFLTNEFSWEDNVNYNVGSHSLKFGGVMRNNQANTINNFRVKGQLEFVSLPSFLNGIARRLRVRIVPSSFDFDDPNLELDLNSNNARSYRQSFFAFFVQDNIRLSPKLNLNLGLRYEPYGVLSETQGRLVNFEPVGNTDFLVHEDRFMENPGWLTLAPRIGIAWDPVGDGKSSLRTGFGIFYEPINPFIINSPYDSLELDLRATGGEPLVFPQLPADTLVDKITSSGPDQITIQGVDFDAGTPYYMKYSLGLQREVLPGNVMSVFYVGSRGVKLLRVSDINSALPTILPDGRKCFEVSCGAASDPVRRNPSHGRFGFRSADVNSVYHSVLLSFTRRMQAGLMLQASYTFSKSIDEAAGHYNSFAITQRSSPTDPDDRNREQGLSMFDRRHNLVISGSYDLPMTGNLFVEGWRLSSILSFSSGSPFTVENSRNISGNLLSSSNFNSRPDLTPGFSNNATEGVSAGCADVAAGTLLGGADTYFDPCAVSLQEAGFLGELGRNTFIGPGVANVDFAIHKTTRLSERTSLEFRSEFFNIFNRANFNSPGQTERRVFTSTNPNRRAGASGRLIQTTTTSRQIQFAVKLLF